MKCINCKGYLNPLAIRQAYIENNELKFEVECMNPHCRTHNYMSKDTYLRLRADFLNLTQEVPYVKNLKLPYEMNVIFVSMERCGISWIIEVLSKVHNIMFGIPISFNDRENKERRELSPIIATRHKFPLPTGWNNVYCVDPQKLIDRGYDKVICVQREYETMKKAHKLYEGAHDRIERMLIHFNRNYKKVYENEIKHPNYLKVHLEDLNRYTVATFNEIMDFLNFPDTGRPIIVPTSPPERNWETWSSIMEKGKKVNKRLAKIDKIYKIMNKK